MLVYLLYAQYSTTITVSLHSTVKTLRRLEFHQTTIGSVVELDLLYLISVIKHPFTVSNFLFPTGLFPYTTPVKRQN